MSFIIYSCREIFKFKFTDKLCQLRNIPRRTDVNHADVHIRIKNTDKRLKLKQLIHESAVGVVRCSGQSDMRLAATAYPFEKISILGFDYVVIRRNNTASIVSNMLRL